jgi:ketosteroid isomerase-like protein
MRQSRFDNEHAIGRTFKDHRDSSRSFGEALDRRDIDRVVDLFEPDGFWRDLAALTWNVYTAEGRDAIRAMLSACLAEIAPTAWNIDQILGSSDGVLQALLSFESGTAHYISPLPCALLSLIAWPSVVCATFPRIRSLSLCSLLIPGSEV